MNARNKNLSIVQLYNNYLRPKNNADFINIQLSQYNIYFSPAKHFVQETLIIIYYCIFKQVVHTVKPFRPVLMFTINKQNVMNKKL